MNNSAESGTPAITKAYKNSQPPSWLYVVPENKTKACDKITKKGNFARS